MNLTIRSYHWFFALILSGLAHGWLIYSLQLFKQEPVEVERVEIPFTVLLADKEVIEQVELEQPETASSEVIPLVSLDEAEQPQVENLAAPVDLSLSGESLELMTEEEGAIDATESAEVVMEQGAELNTLPEHRVVSLVEQEVIEEQEVTTLPELSNVAVLTPQQFAELRQPEAEALPQKSIELLPEVESVEEAPELPELLVDELSLPMDENVLQSPEILPDETGQSDLVLPEVSQQSEVILAEITVEQIEFDQQVFDTLPEVKAEEWKPELATAVKGAKGKGWKSRYRGASGISARYRKKMRSTLTQFVLYPKAIAEEMRIEGKVVIGFTINREGRLEDTEVLESSGHPALDQAGEKMIEFAQPFSSLPKTVKNDKVRFAFPVTIKLKK